MTTLITKRDGTQQPYDRSKIVRAHQWAANGLNLPTDKVAALADRVILYPGISTLEITRTAIGDAAAMISRKEPEWSFFTARLVLQTLYKYANDGSINYPTFSAYLETAIAAGRVDPKLQDMFDFNQLNDAIRPDRDLSFSYLAIQTLADRYLLRNGQDQIIELPQHFWMRIAIGIAQVETTVEARTRRALEYYQTYSTREAGSSTPTMFNSATTFPQLSSCFGHTHYDDTDSIMDNMAETAKYSKFAGGDSISMTRIRAQGSKINSTGGKAGGPIPYVKVYNDILLGFDQSGKRKGVGAVYLEPWHANIFNFLDLRENGDDRVRAHDCFPALWLNDLFMRRVEDEGMWSLFDPKDVPQLPGLFDSAETGFQFTKAYEAAEAAGLAVRQVSAEELWNKIKERYYQHGVFWPCWKDAVNARYMQNAGTAEAMVQHSNLCTEITLRDDETTSFVCNLGSINSAAPRNLLAFSRDEQGNLTFEWNTHLERTVRSWVRNLDSVITIGFIPHPKGRKFQDEDRAIGLGAMGEAQAIQSVGIKYESKEHVQYAFELWRQISLTAIHESAMLARERGVYPNFKNSRWANGQLPSDTLTSRRVIDAFNLNIDLNTPFATEAELRELVKGGMRNSCLMAIAPTATLSNICDVLPSHELPWDLEYVKENLSGRFRVVAQTVLHNPFRLPTPVMREISQKWHIWSMAARGVWIDQAQSNNLAYDPNKNFDELGDQIDEDLFESWKCGNKTSYYLYSRASDDADAVTAAAVSAANAQAEQDGAQACFLRPGDPGFADCAACQ